MSYPFLVDFKFAPGKLLPGYPCQLFFSMLNELEAANLLTPVDLNRALYRKYWIRSIFFFHPNFTSCTLTLKSSKYISAKRSITQGAHLSLIAVALRERTKLFPLGGCERNNDAKMDLFSLF